MINIFDKHFSSDDELGMWFDGIANEHDNFWTVLHYFEIVKLYRRGKISKQIFDRITKDNKLEAFADTETLITKKDIWKFEKSKGGRVAEQEFDDYLVKIYLEKLELCYGTLLKLVREMFADVLLYSLPVLKKEACHDAHEYLRILESAYEQVKGAYIISAGISAKRPKQDPHRLLGDLQDGLDHLKLRASLDFYEMMDLLGYCSPLSPEERLLRAIFDPFESLSRHVGGMSAGSIKDLEAMKMLEFKSRIERMRVEFGNKKMLFVPIDGREIGCLLATRYKIDDGRLVFLSDWVPAGEFDNVPDLTVVDGLKAVEDAIEICNCKHAKRKKCGDVLIIVDCGDEKVSEYGVYEVLNEPIGFDEKLQMVTVIVRSKDRMFKMPSHPRC